MKSTKLTGRIVGILFLLIFISGVYIFQFLQTSLFADDYLTAISTNSNQIILSTLLGLLSGVTAIIISILLFPIFKKHNVTLASIYIAFCILNFIAISIDNVSVLSLLELSKGYVTEGGSNYNSLNFLGALLYERHWWTHYMFMLISCFPVFVLYYTFYTSRLVPRVISVFGIVAVILMFTEMLFSIFGNSISMNMLLPTGLVQLLMPIWLIIKGFSPDSERGE